MWYKKLLLVVLLAGIFQAAKADQQIIIHSPDGNIMLGIMQGSNGSLQYQVLYKGKNVIQPSGLGLKFKSPEVSLTQFEAMGIDSSA